MATFSAAFASGDLQAILWSFLGLDHKSRSSVVVAGFRHDPDIRDSVPALRVQDGRGGFLWEPYSGFRRRALARERCARSDALSGTPPPDESGHYVYVGWNVLTGHRCPVGVRYLEEPPNVWCSFDRETPFATAISDARYWRGDQFWFWHHGRFPDSRAWPRVSQPGWVMVRVPPWYRPWPRGGLPAARRAGQRGSPDLPPDPLQ